MSHELDRMLYSIYLNKVPEIWQSLSYLSCKPLSSWLTDLQLRIDFFANWHDEMPFYLISAFFFPQGFITSVK
jgi:dynein heavy chain, axonemal